MDFKCIKIIYFVFFSLRGVRRPKPIQRRSYFHSRLIPLQLLCFSNEPIGISSVGFSSETLACNHLSFFTFLHFHTLHIWLLVFFWVVFFVFFLWVFLFFFWVFFVFCVFFCPLWVGRVDLC